MRKALVLVLMLCFTSAAFGVELSTAKISAVTGVAETSKIDENKKQVWAPARVDLVLNQGDEIRTREGKVEITFEDGSKINLKENTSLTLDKLKDKDQTGDTFVKLWIGKIRSKFTIQKDDSTFQVQTKNIIAAVKGTDFSLDADSNGSDLVVFEGIVSMKDPVGKKEIFVKAGEKASFAGAFEGKPEEMSEEEKKKQDEEWQDKPKEEKKAEEKKEEEKVPENKASAAPVEPPKEEVKAPEKAGGAGEGFGGSFGAVSIDGKTYYMMSVLFELTLEKFGAGFDVRLLWNDDGIKEDDWQDWQKSVQNMFKYIRYGLKGDPLYIKLGVLSDSMLGHGFLVRRYSNIGIDLYKRTFGLELDIKQGAIGLEGLTNDVMKRRLYAGRLYMDVIPNFLQAGVSGVYDINPAEDKYQLVGTNRVALSESGPLVEYGADVGISLVKTPVLSALIYADYGVFRDGGEGFAAPGVMGKIAIFDYQFEYRSLQSNFVAGLIDYIYEDNRPVLLPAAGGPRLNGVFGQLGANPVPWLRLVAAYEQYEGSLPYVRGEACYKGNFIPKISEVAVGYEQKDIDVVTLKSSNTVAYGRVGMEMAPGVVFLFTMRQTYDPLLDVFKRSTMMAMQMKF
ncbi:MAG: FecR family protein [Candidatus Firestonebacteria bacterium]